MKQLQAWMKKRGMKDAGLAELVNGVPSRAQISRIRRGKNGASPETAKKLQKVTGIPWHEFIGSAA
jgi:transcriptional regulator with XRE-family HTH domain